MKISIEFNSFKLAQVFTISRGSRTQADVLTVVITRGGCHGMGECVPYARYGETMASVSQQIGELPKDFDREMLRNILQQVQHEMLLIVPFGIWKLRKQDCQFGN